MKRLFPAFLIACTACPKSPSAPDAPTAIVTVPKDLPVEGLELSGVAWSAALDRYLVVSDDLESNGKKHVPWIFAMTRDGAIETQPIVIEGIDELNDPESICALPDGTFLVATSHSIGKNGKSQASRRRLLHLALSGRSMRILGRVDLTEVVAREHLDIEAMAFREGVLYIGLKAPLGADGSATILAMSDALKAIDAGHPAPVTEWARPKLCLPSGACEGVADLAFLPNGSLLVVANAPKGGTADGGGALWRLDSNRASPQLLRHFSDGSKPEGITIAPDGQSAIIVFDTDRRPPRWTTWPLS